MCNFCCVRFEVPTLVLLKIPVFWDVTLALEWVVSDIFKVCRVSVCRVKQTIVQDEVDDPFWMAWPCKWRCFNPSKQQEVLAQLPNITSQKTGIYFCLVQFAPRIWYWWIGFKFPEEEQEVFLFCTTAHRPTLGPSQSHSQWVLRALEWW